MSELGLRGHNYLPNGIHNQVLLQLSLGNQTTDTLWKSLVHPLKRLMSLEEFTYDCLGILAQEGHITLVGQDGPVTMAGSECSLTSQGRAMLNFLASQVARSKTLTVAAKKEYTVPEGSYKGEELKVSTPRRGAYDFLALPSRIGDEYIQHPTAHLAKEQQ